MKADDQFLLLMDGCDSVYTADEFKARLRSGKKLRVKLGLDPTAPDLTLGHTVVLRKMRQFQDCGHKALLIIGDYTSMIGDPTGRSKARPVLTQLQIAENAETYLQQAGKVLDLSPDKLEVRKNSEWLARMTCADVLKLMAQMTVARMLERDTFATRQAAGKEIYLHELLYPLMQARDSVEIEADVELGGTDQMFNNLCGRDLQRNAGQPPQIVMLMPILIGTDGKDKMSKSQGNYIGVTDPPGEMYGKLMSIPDGLMPQYFRLLTDLPKEEIAELTESGSCHPRDTKDKLARMLVGVFHSQEAAEAAAAEFRRVHGGGSGGPQAGLAVPDDVPEISLPTDATTDGMISPVELIRLCGFASSNGEARRLVAERGVRLNGEVVTDALEPMAVSDGDVIQRGKRKFARLALATDRA